ncbi:hypothetical protein KC19_6G057200 [Ceratodon purpureus]|uniref:Potassium channel domain-containing protein n=1 Tax=Ceratodon purpureus TaxID=3225 RepID=A0A8T0HFY5_CERPU|nr:hypothetical protein KC19_6G057200 [Ceratodon purpureus]
MESSGAGDHGGSGQPLLEDYQQISESPSEKNIPRVSKSRSIPGSQPKYITKASRSIPVPPEFQREGGGMPTLLKALIGLVAYLIVGILGFSLLEEELRGATTSTIVDAMYFAIVTMTTVGYGDLVPQGVAAKLYTCAFVFVGFGLVGVLVNGAANYLVEKQENILIQKYKKQNSDVEEIVDDDEVVAANLRAAISGAAVGCLFVLGVLVLMFCEGLSFIDAFYCVCVTVTTLGYGDESFNTKGGRLFAVFWILSSTVCVAQFFFYLAECRTEERQRRLAVWALSRATTQSDLEAADLDADGAVSAAEFVIYKLKEVGKIDEDDVLEMLKQFEALDHDQSGTLNWSDINNSSRITQPAHAA